MLVEHVSICLFVVAAYFRADCLVSSVVARLAVSYCFHHPLVVGKVFNRDPAWPMSRHRVWLAARLEVWRGGFAFFAVESLEGFSVQDSYWGSVPFSGGCSFVSQNPLAAVVDLVQKLRRCDREVAFEQAGNFP